MPPAHLSPQLSVYCAQKQCRKQALPGPRDSSWGMHLLRPQKRLLCTIHGPQFMWQKCAGVFLMLFVAPTAGRYQHPLVWESEQIALLGTLLLCDHWTPNALGQALVYRLTPCFKNTANTFSTWRYRVQHLPPSHMPTVAFQCYAVVVLITGKALTHFFVGRGGRTTTTQRLQWRGVVPVLS